MMGRLVAVVLACVLSLGVAVPSAWAGNAADGKAVFSANCAACHLAGKNAVNPAKTSQKSELEQYGMYDIDKIKTQVTNGKMAMPAFGGRLTADQIENVATYVLSQADNGWQQLVSDL